MSKASGHSAASRGKELGEQDRSPMARHRPTKRSSISQESSELVSFCSSPGISSPTHKSSPKVVERKCQEFREACRSNDDARSQRYKPRERGCMPQHEETVGGAVPATCSEPCEPELTDSEIIQELGRWAARKIAGQDAQKLAACFVSANLLPPVTNKSLSELDIGAIIGNAKLRHDVNFDCDLHFRPNFDGEKGKEKMRIAEDYWTALRAELELCNFLFPHGDLPDGCKGESKMRIIKVSERRLPQMFETIREILKNLVPDRDQERVDDQLDVVMLMQQIERGVCDLVSLARWLAELLKAHCAPMRDDWVDKMVKQTEVAVETSRSDFLVEALRELLGILEAMKLDVANHQIRHLRILLIEDTITFEQSHHLSRIARDRVKVDASRQWFARELHRARQMDLSYHLKEHSKFQFETFLSAILRLLLSNNSRDSFPETFYLDSDRLRTLRADLEDLVYFDICCQIFNDLLRRLNYRGLAPSSSYQALRQTLFTIVKQTGFASNRQWIINLENIAVELVRHALHECHLSHSYDPRLVQLTDDSLKRVFLTPYPNIFALHAERVHRCIFPPLLEMAESHLNLSPIDMFNSLVVHAVQPPPPVPPVSNHSSAATSVSTHSAAATTTRQSVSPGIDHLTHIVRRITHVAVLHWRVWSPIVYARVDGKGLSSLSSTPAAAMSNALVSGTEADASASLTRQRSSTASKALPIRQQTAPSIQTVNLESPLPSSATKDSDNAESGTLRNTDPGAEAPALER